MNINNTFIEENYKLFQYIASKIGNKLSKEDREDLVQETILDILKAGDKGTEALQEGASAYVTRVMTNVFIDKGRTDSRDALPGAPISLDAEVDRFDPDVHINKMTYHEVIPDKSVPDLGVLYRDDIHDLCSQLPPRQAELFNMRYYLGMTQKEIVEATGLSVDNVDVTLRRSVRSAYRVLGKEISGVP